MASKKGQAGPTNEELLAQFDDLGVEEEQAITESTKAAPTQASKSRVPPQRATDEHDPLAELDNLVSQRPASRPATPSIRAPNAQRSPARSSTATPPPGAKTSEEKLALPRKSAESTRSFHTSFTPATAPTPESEPEKRPDPSAAPALASAQAAGGGWWGSLLSTATAAKKQAEAAYQELQKNEEAQKWAEQVRGNVGALRGLGEPLIIICYVV